MSSELVIDVGSATTVIAEKGKGIVLEEPSVILAAKQRGKLKLIASGNDVKRKLKGKERTDATLIYPIKDGIIDNAEAATLMLGSFIQKATPHRTFLSPKPEAIATISCGTSIVERKNYENVLLGAGIKSPVLVETPLAVSALLPSDKNLIVVCGASLTEIAIVGASGIVTGCSVTISGNSIDAAIIAYVSDNYRMRISAAQAGELRERLGSFTSAQSLSADITGRNLVDNTPRRVEITANEISAIMANTAASLAEVVESVSMMCPETMIMDVYHSGITLCGGLANSYGLSDCLAEKLHMVVNVPKTPEHTAVLGALQFFDDRDKLYNMLK